MRERHRGRRFRATPLVERERVTLHYVGRCCWLARARNGDVVASAARYWQAKSRAESRGFEVQS